MSILQRSGRRRRSHCAMRCPERGTSSLSSADGGSALGSGQFLQQTDTLPTPNFPVTIQYQNQRIKNEGSRDAWNFFKQDFKGPPRSMLETGGWISI